MHAVLNELDSQQKRLMHSNDDGSKDRLNTVQAGCREVLKSVDDALLKYKSLGPEKKRLRDRVRWGLENVGDLRIRLISNTNMLTLFMAGGFRRCRRDFLLKGLRDTVSLRVAYAD